MLTRRRW